ncbi:MAG: ATP-binding cassette domain-containing protein [Pseudomonadota bacterium]
MIVLQASGLRVAYGRAAPVLDGIEIGIGAGERVALVGPNGAGKSTLLRALTGLQPASGDRWAFGTPLTPEVRRRLGFVWQHHALVRCASALTNVVHGLLDRRGGWRAVSARTAPAAMRTAGMAALSAVGLADRAGCRADRLSGGQAQRVAIARALVRAPDLLVADEPAASLDPAAGHDVMARLTEVAEGRTVLFTSHDMDHARAYATRIVALRGGRIVLDRPAHDLGSETLQALFA